MVQKNGTELLMSYLLTFLIGLAFIFIWFLAIIILAFFLHVSITVKSKIPSGQFNTFIKK